MPSFDVYKKMLGNNNIGQAIKAQSDMIMEATWDSDLDAKTAYFYSQKYDDEFEKSDDLHPELSKTKIPVKVKLFEMEYNSLSKDEVAWHLIFQPSFDYHQVIPYYDEDFAKVTKSMFPIGLYLDYPDSKGIYHRWLVVGQYRYYGNQFPSYQVLPADYKLQWIFERKKYECWGVLRSQNSYNSGVWTDYKTTEPENQKIIWMPYNDKTVNIFYDQRVAISEPRKEPVVWKCTKVEDMNVRGIIRITWAQDQWNEHTDYVEKTDDGLVRGIWCDYFTTDGIAPTDTTPKENIHSVISYVGKSTIKVGGSYKKFTVDFFDGEKPIDFMLGQWKFEIDGNDVSSLLKTSTDDIEKNQIKVQFIGSDKYMGKTLVVSYITTTGITSSVDIAVTGV
jgi:hypothetical protein